MRLAFGLEPGWTEVVLLGMLVLLAACGESLPAISGPPDEAFRIVSLSPPATEILFALGAGERLVGRSAYCDWPAAAQDLPAVGDAISARAESILLLKPDLVLLGSRAQRGCLMPIEEVVWLQRVRVESVADVKESIRWLAAMVAKEEAGERLLGLIDRALRGAGARHAPGSGPRVLFVVQREPLRVAGGGSYVDELLGIVGARNVAGDFARLWPVLSLESLIIRNPEIVLDASVAPGTGGDAGVDFWSDFPTLEAVKNGRVVYTNEPALVRPGPRLPAAIRALENLVWERQR